MGKIIIDNKEIDYITIDERGRVVDSGELDTFQNTLIDLNSIEVGKRIRLTFNGTKWTTLNYKTLSYENN